MLKNRLYSIKGKLLKMYYDDLQFRVVVHHFFASDMLNPFYAGTNSIEFIRFGQMKLIDSDTGKTATLIGPAIYWLHKGRKYQYCGTGDQNSNKFIEHIYCDFNGDRSDRIIAALDKLFPNGFFVPESPDKISETFFDLLKLYRSDRHENLPQMGFIIEKLVNAAYLAAKNNIPAYDDPYELEKIAEKLRSEPFADYDFHRIANTKGLSIDHFRRLFRAKHDLTPKEYLHRQRMIRAAELLEFDNVRIKEIVYSCRFKSFIDFSRSFKKFSGLSPRQYRQMTREQQGQ